jgi:hypothetical protein
MYLKLMNTRLKVTINCTECNAERLITKACLSLVKRCKPCQKIFNRDKARNRYREIKGIPLDKPIEAIIQKKEKKEVKKEAPKAFPIPAMVKVKTPPVPVLTKEEQEKREAVMLKLFSTLEDDSSDDDW